MNVCVKKEALATLLLVLKPILPFCTLACIDQYSLVPVQVNIEQINANPSKYKFLKRRYILTNLIKNYFRYIFWRGRKGKRSQMKTVSPCLFRFSQNILLLKACKLHSAEWWLLEICWGFWFKCWIWNHKEFTCTLWSNRVWRNIICWYCIGIIWT